MGLELWGSSDISGYMILPCFNTGSIWSWSWTRAGRMFSNGITVERAHASRYAAKLRVLLPTLLKSELRPEVREDGWFDKGGTINMV